jgi:hypothetical protein
LQEQKNTPHNYSNCTSSELQILVENSINEEKYFGIKEPSSHLFEFLKLKEKLIELRFNYKFHNFLKVTDLDPVKFFAGEYTESSTVKNDVRLNGTKVQPQTTTYHQKKLSYSPKETTLQSKSTA